MKSLFSVPVLATTLVSSFLFAMPVRAQAISKTMCLDSAHERDRLKQTITGIIKDAQKRGLLPALAYEGYNLDNSKLTVSLRANLKADEEAKRLSAALFAAVAQPASPAQAASGIVTGNPFKPSSYSLKDRCPAQRGQPQLLVQCTGDAGDPMSSGVRDPIDMGLSISQVYETDLDSEKVIQNFMKVKLMSSVADTVSVCSGSQNSCRQAYKYSPALAARTARQPIEIGHEYYVQDATTLAKKFGIPIVMTNRSVLKVSEIKDICGGSAYLVSAFNSGADKGFDRATLLTLVAKVGDKTLVIGDFSGQAMGLESGGGNGWPLSFPADETAVNETVTKGYNGIAELIGSTDRLKSYGSESVARVPASQSFRSGFTR